MLMHTVTCVRTLSIGPRRHGPRLCVFRLCVAKVALRRPRSRERRCPVAASRCHRTKSALLATFQGGRAAKSSWCRKKGLHPARPTGGRAGTAMAHSSRAPTPARAPKHRSLADFKPSVRAAVESLYFVRVASVRGAPKSKPEPSPQFRPSRFALKADRPALGSRHQHDGALRLL